ncbi:MAG: phosphatidylinositol mannoside acyltransferase [Actinomycetales bacterium]|nr:phosphatidylinositol mannoside acyltransferase [Actinomycetales bacterium]
MSTRPRGPVSRVARAQDAATEWAFSAGWRLVRLLPEHRAREAFQQAADAMWWREGPSVQQLQRNLARARPGLSRTELRHLSRQGLRSYLRYWCEAFRLPSWSLERISSTFHMDGQELMDEAVRSGSGAMMVPGHMANWDHAGAWGALRYGSVVTVAERLRPEGLFEQFLDYRRRLGMEVLGLGEADVLRTLARRLAEGRVVALLGDRDISRNGIEVMLLGQPASLPAGPALLSIMTGAPLYPVGMWFEEEGTFGRVLPRVEVPEGLPRAEQVQVMTQQVADRLGAAIAERPVSWHMLQPVWLADLDPARRAR